MRSALFLRLLLSLSLSGSMLAGAVWLCRRLMGRHLSRAALYYLWLPVLLRLVLPFGAPGSVMAVAAARLDAAAIHEQEIPAPADPVLPQLPEGAVLQPDVPQSENQMAAVSLQPTVPQGTPTATNRVALTLSPADALVLVWAAGAAFCFLRDLAAYLRLRRTLRAESVPVDPEDLALFRQRYGQSKGLLRVRLVCSTAATTPMMLGLLRPVLVLPARAYCRQSKTDQLRLLLRHEMTHYRRGDLWYKWFLLAVRSVHWFNPMMPALLRTVEQDCEQACDEAVAAALTPEQRRCYGAVLLEYAGAALPVGSAATTLAYGKKELLRQRLTTILHPHKRGMRGAALAAALALLLTGCGAVLGAAGAPEEASADGTPSGPVQSSKETADSTPQAGVSPSDSAPIPASDEVLVPVLDYIAGVYVDLKYASADNLAGMPLYDFTEPLLRYGTVKKLVQAQIILYEQGYSLKIWDAYRPLEAQQALWNACPDPTYVSDPATGYLGHTRGNTVDVTLVLRDGTELPMPSGFDQFDARADRDYSDVSAEAADNARRLEQAMTAAGFIGYEAEWSHYRDSVEYGMIPAQPDSSARDAYAAFLAGDRSLLSKEDTLQRWVPDFGTDGFAYEYALMDLDGDGGEELLVQMAGSPEGYNGVFHYAAGELCCWNSDYAEGNCRDYPLRDGTILRQYDLGGSCSYILYRYRSDGTLRETGRLFVREYVTEGEDPAPAPYYEANGTELDAAAFTAQLDALMQLLPAKDFWQAL